MIRRSFHKDCVSKVVGGWCTHGDSQNGRDRAPIDITVKERRVVVEERTEKDVYFVPDTRTRLRKLRTTVSVTVPLKFHSYLISPLYILLLTIRSLLRLEL